MIWKKKNAGNYAGLAASLAAVQAAAALALVQLVVAQHLRNR